MSSKENAELDTSAEGVVATQDPEIPERFENPGLPPHKHRVTDVDEKAAKRAERQVAGLFTLSIIGTVIGIAGFVMFRPLTAPGGGGQWADFGRLQNLNFWLGGGIALSMFGIGLGMVHWAKTLMPDEEYIEERKEMTSTDEDREVAGNIIQTGLEESGIARRPIIAIPMLGAMLMAPLAGTVALLRSMGPAPKPSEIEKLFGTTKWKKGVRLARDPQGTAIKAEDVTMGSVFHVVPEGLKDAPHYLEEKAKAAVLLVRLEDGKVKKDPAREGWDVNGIYAYSKICTHVGCPVALYEQQTHHLLCPCHQSTFDLTDHCKVIFGPAKRPLPQLPIDVDDEGYLIAQSDFKDTPGPSFWERG